VGAVKTKIRKLKIKKKSSSIKNPKNGKIGQKN
jgi:hypothetical protein